MSARPDGLVPSLKIAWHTRPGVKGAGEQSKAPEGKVCLAGSWNLGRVTWGWGQLKRESLSTAGPDVRHRVALAIGCNRRWAYFLIKLATCPLREEACVCMLQRDLVRLQTRL